MSDLIQNGLVALSKWIDEANAGRDDEAKLWGRVAKVAEEGGEAIAALVGATGQNPRKGVTHTMDDVVEELLDVAVSALGAIEHIQGHKGNSLALLDEKIVLVGVRAGVLTLLPVSPRTEIVPAPAACVHCGIELGKSIGDGLFVHANHRQRCQSDAVPYGHMGHPTMPCPPDDGFNPCSGSREDHCTHLAPKEPTDG